MFNKGMLLTGAGKRLHKWRVSVIDKNALSPAIFYFTTGVGREDFCFFQVFHDPDGSGVVVFPSETQVLRSSAKPRVLGGPVVDNRSEMDASHLFRIERID